MSHLLGVGIEAAVVAAATAEGTAATALAMRLVGGMDAAAPIVGSAGADTAGARNFWRYVTRPPIAPRAATTGFQRSTNHRGDAGMGEADFGQGALSVGLAEEPVWRRLQRSSAAPRERSPRSC